MTELTPQEKLLKLQAMGKMPTDDWFQNYVKLAQENAALVTKVEAANKIIKKICGQCLNEKCTEGGDCHISDLKKALEIPRNRELNATEQYADACQQIDKQRKEECQVGGVPQNVPSCKELKPEVFRDCQGYTSKIVKKENKRE